MKKRSSFNILCWLSLVLVLFTGQAAGQGFVWCLGEDGHVAFESLSDKDCASEGGQSGGAVSPWIGMPDAECGPCLDLDACPELISAGQRISHAATLAPAPVPAALPTRNFSPVPLRVLPTGLNPQPPPRLSTALLIHRTTVLLN